MSCCRIRRFRRSSTFATEYDEREYDEREYDERRFRVSMTWPIREHDGTERDVLRPLLTERE